MATFEAKMLWCCEEPGQTGTTGLVDFKVTVPYSTVGGRGFSAVHKARETHDLGS